MIGVKFAALEGFEEKMGAEARLEAERAALVPCPRHSVMCCVAACDAVASLQHNASTCCCKWTCAALAPLECACMWLQLHINIPGTVFRAS